MNGSPACPGRVQDWPQSRYNVQENLLKYSIKKTLIFQMLLGLNLISDSLLTRQINSFKDTIHKNPTVLDIKRFLCLMDFQIYGQSNN
jgi:hypothetical protein